MDRKNIPEHMALTSDFAAWEMKNPEKIICSGKSVTEDGRLVFNLSINDTEFRLLCPTNYPNHEDSFFMETECTDFWCIALNEFIIDSPEKLTLDVILAKTFLYYTPCSRNSCDSSENESENENENEIESELNEDFETRETDEWESMISKKKREWKAKEGELRLRYNRPKISDMFDGKIIDHPQQVFSNSAASEILINDLINIMGSKESDGIIVNTVDDDICRWSVFLKDFHPHSKISNDLKKTEELYGYDNIQLRLDFIMDLYPFHPPLIQFVRPKLLGVFDREEFVELANWNPARDMMSVLKEIKDYIDRNGRIDIDNKRNGIKVEIVKKILIELSDALKQETITDAPYSLIESRCSEQCPAGTEDSYSSIGKNVEIEKILTTLSQYLKSPVCEENTFDSPESHSYFTLNLAMNDNIFDERNCKVRLSETTSYSSSIFRAINRLIVNKKSETQSRYVNHQKTDMPCNRKRSCNIITNPAFGLGCKSRNSTHSRNEKYSVDNVSLHGTNGPSNYRSRNNKNNSNSSEQKNNTNIKQFDNSVVSSFNANIKTLEGLSTTASLNDLTFKLSDNSSRVSRILEESVLLPFIRSKLAEDPFFEIWLSTSLYSKITQIIIDLASNPYLIDLLAISDMPDQSIADLLRIQKETVMMILEKLADLANGHSMTQADLDKAKLAKIIIDASKFVESELKKHSSRKRSDKVFSVPNNNILDSNSSNYRVESLDSVYKDSLKDLKFCNCNIDLENHTFKNHYIADTNLSRSYFGIAQEFAVLSEYLPLELSSAIFVRIDNSRPSLMRALIIGAEGTCCSGGCFSFDIYLRKNYPDDGLEISYITFGDGKKMTFSSFGKDVSSPDPRSSTKTSNVLQVLTFIKNHKLIPLMAYGENRNNWDQKIKLGPEEILLTNVVRFAMIDQMREPTPGFKEVIETHFRIKKDRILSELEQYDFLKNSELLNTLKKEFDRLTCSK